MYIYIYIEREREREFTVHEARNLALGLLVPVIVVQV